MENRITNSTIKTMNTFIGMRTNIFYTKVEGKMEKWNELIMMAEEPEYSMTKDAKVVRKMKLKSFRFAVNKERLGAMIKMLQELEQATEDDLQD